MSTHTPAAVRGVAVALAYALLMHYAQEADGEDHTAMVARPAMKVALPRKTWYGASTSRLLWLNLGHRKPVAPRTNCAKAHTAPHQMLSADPHPTSGTSQAATLHHETMPYENSALACAWPTRHASVRAGVPFAIHGCKQSYPAIDCSGQYTPAACKPHGQAGITPEKCRRESMRHAWKPHLGSQQHQGGEAQVGVRGVEVGRGHWPLLCVGVKGCNKCQCDTDHGQGVQRGVHELALRPAYSMAEIQHDIGMRRSLHPGLRGTGTFHRDIWT